jgi:hypothetical protein
MMIVPPCTNPAPLGAGVHCDVSAIPELKISLRLRTGNMVQSQPGGAIAAEQNPKERHNYY